MWTAGEHYHCHNSFWPPRQLKGQVSRWTQVRPYKYKTTEFPRPILFLKCFFFIRKIANVHKSRENSITNPRVLTTKLRPFSPPGRSCFTCAPRHQGISCAQFPSRHWTAFDCTEQAGLPGLSNHWDSSCDHSLSQVKPLALSTVLRLVLAFCRWRDLKRSLSNLSGGTQQDGHQSCDSQPRQSDGRGHVTPQCAHLGAPIVHRTLLSQSFRVRTVPDTLFPRSTSRYVHWNLIPLAHPPPDKRIIYLKPPSNMFVILKRQVPFLPFSVTTFSQILELSFSLGTLLQ